MVHGAQEAGSPRAAARARMRCAAQQNLALACSRAVRRSTLCGARATCVHIALMATTMATAVNGERDAGGGADDSDGDEGDATNAEAVDATAIYTSIIIPNIGCSAITGATLRSKSQTMLGATLGIKLTATAKAMPRDNPKRRHGDRSTLAVNRW